MARMTQIERARRAAMIIDLLTQGSAVRQAAEAHGVTRQRVEQILRTYRDQEYVRDVDGVLVWTREGRSYRGWLDDAPGAP